MVIRELNEAQARAGIRKLKDRGIEAVAIATLWSTQNPAHERRLRDLVVQELPGVFVSMSHEISPGVGEYARMSTTAANAAIGPLAGRYLSGLEARLRQAGMKAPVLMMTCAGGVLPTAVLSERPAYALFSGPAGGVMGSRATGAQAGSDNIVTVDIGGTSFDVGVIVSGKPIMRSEISVAGADIRVHSIDVQSIGAGGGSIAYVEFGELRVGPRSAGANPGPACYGRGGTRPTATDADLMLGVLDPDNFIGGRMKLDVAAARRAIDAHVAAPLGMSMVEAAWSIRQILDSRMADLLRRMTIERGYDPRDFTLLANGGAGPSHAWVLCEELGLDSFIVATAESAYGAGNSDLGFSAERPAYARVSPAPCRTPSNWQGSRPRLPQPRKRCAATSRWPAATARLPASSLSRSGSAARPIISISPSRTSALRSIPSVRSRAPSKRNTRPCSAAARPSPMRDTSSSPCG
jgi:N-methylhydantoinase A